MSDLNEPRWPRIAGGSLLLLPTRVEAGEWTSIESRMHAAVIPLGVSVSRGLAQCPAHVRAGAAASKWIRGDDVLVFACPADIGVFEAAPLIGATETGMMLDEVGHFFRTASLVALAAAPEIAWIAAHDWAHGDRVRFSSGNVDSLVHFATSPGAWRTQFVGVDPHHIRESAEWPYCFVVSR
jgi:hypothetical protein